jgi:hypothetical protein
MLTGRADKLMTASTYGWAITYDHLDHNQTWVTGPHNISAEMTSLLREAATAGRTRRGEFPDVEWFRIYDDDRELYYTGLRTGEAEPCGWEDGFEPLTDFGTPNAGATEIRYLKPPDVSNPKEIWETL